MICFLDRTFCSAYGDMCSNSDCIRALTPELRSRGKVWWGGDDFPIAFSDFWEGCLEREHRFDKDN